MTERTDRRVSRRRLLAGLGAVSMSSTAGCLTSLPAFGQRVRFGDINEPAAGSPVYRDWIPARLEEGNRLGHLHFEHVVPGERGNGVVENPYGGRFVKDMDYVGVDFESFEYVTHVGGTSTVVGRGDIDRTAVAETLAQTSYEPDGSYRGLDMYRRSGPSRALAVGDNLVAVCHSGRKQRQILEAILDTGAGRKTRQHETDDEFARVTNTARARPWTILWKGGNSIAGTEPVLRAETANVGESYAYLGQFYLFPRGSSVSKTDIREFIRQFPQALDATRVDIRMQGRLATIIGKLTPAVYSQLTAAYEKPLITWGIDYDSDTETLTVTHEAGERIDASRLTLQLNDLQNRTQEESNESRFTPTDRQFTDSTRTVGPGDSLSIDLSGHTEWVIVLQGESPDGEYNWRELYYSYNEIE